MKVTRRWAIQTSAATAAVTAGRRREILLVPAGAVGAGAAAALFRPTNAWAANEQIRFSEVNRVPLFYPGTREYTATSNREFYARLEDFIRDLKREVPGSRGSMRRIYTLGAYVDKPEYHGRDGGRAFDLASVHWQHMIISPLAGEHASDRSKIRHYLGLEAMCRRWFDYVLDGWYDTAHANHLHLDDAFRDRGARLVLDIHRRSMVLFVQAACRYIFDQRVEIDGNFGPQTQAALRKAKQQVSVTGDLEKSEASWRGFLRRTANKAFK